MERYESLDDVDTHDEDLVIICDHDELFGESVDDLADEIRDEIDGDSLTLEEHPNGTARIDQHGWLVQHSVWLIHCEQLLETEDGDRLEHYLTSYSIPEQTQIYVCVEEKGRDVCETLEDDYRDRVDVVTGKGLLVAQASTYLNTVNPARGRAGKEAIMAWNNAVCTLLEDFGGVNHG